jgi:cytochrome c oxidase subunit 2
MTTLIILLCVLLVAIIAVQIGKISEISAKIRGEKEVAQIDNNRQAWWLMAFMVALLVITSWSAYYYKNYMLGYGPHESASAHGSKIDVIFNITLIITGIVFFVTQIALFWFSYKYKEKVGRKVLYIPHDNKLEIIWTIIPAVAMAILVVGGLDAWNDIMADVKEDEDFIEIEATGFQFGWELRYPGQDGLLGTRDFRLITPTNSLGQDWTDIKNHDDLKPDEIVLPVGKKVRVRITSKDVLHNFYLPHFRVKMDAVPGMPTYFVFTPTTTTEEYRQKLSKYPEYQVKRDPSDPESPTLWESFNYELACAELCGSGHYSMRRLVRVVSEAEYETWLKSQSSFYLSQIRNTDADPLKGQELKIDAMAPKAEEAAPAVDTTKVEQ